MKINNQMLFKINDYYTKDDCMQIMLYYQSNLTFLGKFKGEQRIMYNHLIESGEQEKPNLYLFDDRRIGFPYNNIPTHLERVGLHGKFIATNQIINYEEPYISFVDGRIVKHTGFKDGNDFYLHNKVLRVDDFDPYEEKIVSREYAEKYIETGYLDGIDNNDYKRVVISDGASWFYRNELESDESITSKQQAQMLNIINYYITSNHDRNLLVSAVTRLEDVVLPYEYDPRIMIKFGYDGSLKIEEFVLSYKGSGEFELCITNIPVTKESLTKIKSNVMLPKIKMHREPNVSLRLNPNVTRNDLAQVERQMLGNRLELKHKRMQNI